MLEMRTESIDHKISNCTERGENFPTLVSMVAVRRAQGNSFCFEFCIVARKRSQFLSNSLQDLVASRRNFSLLALNVNGLMQIF